MNEIPEIVPMIEIPGITSEEREQLSQVLHREAEHKKMVEEKEIVVMPYRTAKFWCPDCWTFITIRTRLNFDHKPWRMACPCQYSSLHRMSDWEEDGFNINKDQD